MRGSRCGDGVGGELDMTMRQQEALIVGLGHTLDHETTRILRSRLIITRNFNFVRYSNKNLTMRP